MPPQQTNSPAQKQILIIEDEKDIAELYAKLLKSVGYNVTIVVDGNAGLAEVDKGSHNLILLDLMLPGKSGLEILQAFQEKHKLSETVVLVLTNVQQDPIISRCYELGAKGYIVKSSISNRELIEQVNEHLGIQMNLPEERQNFEPIPETKKTNLISQFTSIFSKKS